MKVVRRSLGRSVNLITYQEEGGWWWNEGSRGHGRHHGRRSRSRSVGDGGGVNRIPSRRLSDGTLLGGSRHLSSEHLSASITSATRAARALAKALPAAVEAVAEVPGRTSALRRRRRLSATPCWRWAADRTACTTPRWRQRRFRCGDVRGTRRGGGGGGGVVVVAGNYRLGSRIGRREVVRRRMARRDVFIGAELRVGQSYGFAAAEQLVAHGGGQRGIYRRIAEVIASNRNFCAHCDVELQRHRGTARGVVESARRGERAIRDERLRPPEFTELEEAASRAMTGELRRADVGGERRKFKMFRVGPRRRRVVAQRKFRTRTRRTRRRRSRRRRRRRRISG